MVSFTERAKADWKRLTGDKNGWGTEINVERPDGSSPVDVVGLAIKHHLKVDGEGLVINGKNAHATISEEALTDQSYVVRDSDDEVDMEDHHLEWIDSAGFLKKYVVTEAWADEKVGVIVFVLGDFEG